MHRSTRTALTAIALLAAAGCSTTTTEPASTSSISETTSTETTSTEAVTSIIDAIDAAANGRFECRVAANGTVLAAYGVDGVFAYRTRAENVSVAYGNAVFVRVYDPNSVATAARPIIERNPDRWLRAEVDDPTAALGLSSATECLPEGVRIERVVASTEEPGMSTFDLTTADGVQGTGWYREGAAGAVAEFVLDQRSITITAGGWRGTSMPWGVPAEGDLPDAVTVDAAEIAIVAPLPV